MGSLFALYLLINLQINAQTLGNWHSMAIVEDYSNMNETSKVNYLKLTLMPLIRKRLNMVLKVQGSGKIPKLESNPCSVEIPSSYFSQSTTGDLLLIFNLDNSKSLLASAYFCNLFSQDDGRPIVGVVTLSNVNFKFTQDNVQANFDTLLHELFHVLAIHEDLFKKLPAGTLKENSSKLITISSPNFLAYVKSYYNCPTATGLLFENEGGDATARNHLERIFNGDELMTGNDPSIKLSPFTLNIAKDYGFYQVDMNFADIIYWGYNKGCKFIDGSCNKGMREFCSTEGKQGCNYDYRSKSVCTSNFSNNCPYYNNIGGGDCASDKIDKQFDFEVSGKTSKCFVVKSTVETSGCFVYSCNGASLSVTLGGTSFECKTEGQEISYSSVKIVCPNPEVICGKGLFPVTCPKDCSGRGNCMQNGTCFCYFGYQGTACDEEYSCQAGSVCSSIVVPTSTSSELIANVIALLLILQFK